MYIIYHLLFVTKYIYSKLVTFSISTLSQGVRAIVTAQDVPGSNITGLGNDEQVFADETVTAIGQVIAVVVAESQPLAQRAAKAVKIIYKDLPSILTIEVTNRRCTVFPNLCSLFFRMPSLLDSSSPVFSSYSVGM